MKRQDNAPRHEKQILVHGKVHTIIEQDTTIRRPDWQKGAYLGHKGYVLKRIDELSAAVEKSKIELI